MLCDCAESRFEVGGEFCDGRVNVRNHITSLAKIPTKSLGMSIAQWVVECFVHNFRSTMKD